MVYEENRVRVKDFGVVPMGDDRLVTVPGIRGKPRILHWAAASGLRGMDQACQDDIGQEILVASGWRRHRWKSWEHYTDYVVKKYGSLREGRKWLAYNSPHETGLALDIGSGGLWPTKKTRAKQRKTRLHKWLVEHAHEFGWTPYKAEPWHWEYHIDQRVWRSLPSATCERLT